MAENSASGNGALGGLGGAGANYATAAAAAPAEPPRVSRQVTIDHDALEEAGMVSARSERSLIAEEFRMIKRPLILKAFDDNASNSAPSRAIWSWSAVHAPVMGRPSLRLIWP